MTTSVIAIYHKTQPRFLPYQDGEPLTQVITHTRDLPAGESALRAADWAFHVFNADLDTLEASRDTTAGEADFLIGCVYRLLGLRSLSVGDVVSVTTGGDTEWLACESVGWSRITAPSHVDGGPLSAQRVYAAWRAER